MIKEEQIQDEAQQLQQKQSEKQAIDSLTSALNSHDQFRTLLLKEFKDMQGTPEQKTKRLMNRLQKFFFKDSKINIKNGFFCKRREPFYESYSKQKRQIKLINNEVIIFGIDFIKIREIMKAYLPEDFQTIDMSHIKLIFKDFDHAMESLRRNMREDVIENETKLQPHQTQPPKGWTEMRPYYFNKYERRLLARFATEQQREIRHSNKIESEIPQYAKRLYNLKKKQSEDIEQNYRLREQIIRQRKMQNRQRRGFHNFQKQNDQRSNHYKKSQNLQVQDDNMSQKSFTLKIGGLRPQRQESNRQRSRERDLQDNRSICSRRSSASSLVNKFQNNLNLEERAESESVLSDVSFILDQEHNRELFEDMALRMGLINIRQNNLSRQDSMQLSPHNKHEESFASSKSSSSSAYRRLTGDIPDKPNESFSNQSFTKKKWKYDGDYVDSVLQQERKRQEAKKQEKAYINIISDDDQ